MNAEQILLKHHLDGKDPYTNPQVLSYTPTQKGKQTLTFEITNIGNVSDKDSLDQTINFGMPLFTLTTGKSKSPFEPAAGGSGGATGASFPTVPLNGATAVAVIAGVGVIGVGYALVSGRTKPLKASFKSVYTPFGKEREQQKADAEAWIQAKWEEAKAKYRTELARSRGTTSVDNVYLAKTALAKLATAKSPAEKKKYEAEAKQFLQAAGYTTAEAKSVVKTFTSPSIFGSPAIAQKEYNQRVNEILSGKIITPVKTEKKKQDKGILDSVGEFVGGIVNGIGGFFANVFGSAKTGNAVKPNLSLAGFTKTETRNITNATKNQNDRDENKETEKDSIKNFDSTVKTTKYQVGHGIGNLGAAFKYGMLDMLSSTFGIKSDLKESVVMDSKRYATMAMRDQEDKEEYKSVREAENSFSEKESKLGFLPSLFVDFAAVGDIFGRATEALEPLLEVLTDVPNYVNRVVSLGLKEIGYLGQLLLCRKEDDKCNKKSKGKLLNNTKEGIDLIIGETTNKK